MAINNSDKFLVNDGTKTETITFAQFKDGTVLNDSDKFLINDGTKTETITWAEIENEIGPTGIVNTPTVLKPNDGAGSGDMRYLRTDKITQIEGGGVATFNTDTIQTVTAQNVTSVNATAAWSGYVGETWATDTSWSGLGASSGLGDVDGTAGTGGVESITTPWSVTAGDFGAGIRGASGWALKFDEVVTISFDPSTAVSKIIACQSPGERIDQGTEYVGPFPKVMRGQVFWLQCGGAPAVDVFGNIDGGGNLLAFPTNANFDRFVVGDVVQNPNATVVAKDGNASPPTITVGGGSWKGSDGSGDPSGATKLTKTIAYDTKLTLAGDTDLADIAAIRGTAEMTDGTGSPGPYTQTPYKLTTSQIVQITDLDLIFDEIIIAGKDWSDPPKDWSGVTETVYAPSVSILKIDDTTVTTSSHTVTLLNIRSDGNPPRNVQQALSNAFDGNAGTYAQLFNDLTDDYNDGQTASGGYAKEALQFKFDAEISADKVEVQVSHTYVSIYFKRRGAIIASFHDSQLTGVANVTPSGTVLTFADPCVDLPYFKVGDELEGSLSTVDVRTGDNSTAYDDCTPEEMSLKEEQTVGAGRIIWVRKVDFTATPLKIEWVSGNGLYIQKYPNSDDLAGAELLYAGTESFTIDGTIDAQYVRIYAGGAATGCNFRFTEDGTATVIAEPDLVNRKLTVNGGRWAIPGEENVADSYKRVWTDDTTTTGNGGNWGPDNPVDYFFDGKLDTYAHANIDAKGATVKVVFNPPLAATTGVTFIGSITGSGTAKWRVNSETELDVTANNTPTVENNFPFVGDITEVVIRKTSNDAQGLLCTALKVDGNFLINGIDVPKLTQAKYQTKGGKGTIVSVDETAKTITVTYSTDRDERWIADNEADTDFYVAGPSVVDEPLLTTDVELQSSEFATTPPGVDGLKEIIWNLNGVDQPGTTLNPYKPSGLATNTEYTVKVKHVAQKLDPSEWSTSTTFTTGASRSLQEHYTTQILALQQRITELEDDANPPAY